MVALGTGIGIVAGGFSVFHQGLYGELPFPNGDRWVSVESFDEATGGRTPLELERVRRFRTAASSLAYLAGTETGDYNVVHANGEVERIAGATLSPGTFRYLPYRPTLGRLLTAEDGAAGAPPVALIRESLWERRFSQRPEVLGSRLTIAGVDHTVVGVLPDDAGYPDGGELWIPLPEETLGAAAERDAVASRVVAILADGVTPEQAQAQLAQISARASAPGSGLASLRLTVRPLASIGVSPQIQVAVALFMTVLFSVLVIISANVANLVMARTSRRMGELAVRTALGASRARLVGQIFVETLVMGVMAAALGLAAAGGILSLYDGILDELPFWVDLGLRPSTAAAVAALALVAVSVTGVLPALKATRGAPGDALRASGRATVLGVGRIGGFMIAAEVALSVALLGSAALFAQGFQRYVDPGLQLPDERVLTARLRLDLEEEDLPVGGASTVADSLSTVLTALGRSAATLPGVTGVGFTSHLPRISPHPEPLEVDGRPDVIPTPVVAMGPGLLEVLDARPLLGRNLREDDLAEGAPAVALVNRAFAVEHFGTTQVLGRRIRLAAEPDNPEPGPWREIVGVVPDVMEVAGSERGAGIYVPLTPRRFVSIALRVDGDPMALTGALRRQAYDVDPNLTVLEVVRLDGVGAENRMALGVMSSGLMGIGIITLLLSLAGVYSIVSLTVSQRTREIGVRVALGADPGRILRSVLRRSGVLVLGGAVVGAVVGYRISTIRLFVFAVPDGGWWLFPALVCLMGVAGGVACWVPARRALGIQPVEALRRDG